MKLYYNIVGLLLVATIVLGGLMPLAISISDDLVVVGSSIIFLVLFVPGMFKWFIYILSLTEKGDTNA